MPLTRLWVMAGLVAALALLSLAGPDPAKAQSYPSKSVTILVAFPAGGFADSFARLLGSRLSERLGQTVVIEDRPGAEVTLARPLRPRLPPTDIHFW